MSDTRYKVVFNGELMPGANLDATKDTLANLFKSDRHKIEQLFSSPNVAIKRDLTEAEAQKYVDVLARAGIKTFPAVELASTLSLIKTEEHDDHSKQKRMICPKCQTEQVQAISCSSCGIAIEKYIARLEQQKTAAPTATPYAPPRANISTYEGETGPLNPFTLQGRIGRLRYIAWSIVMCFAAVAVTIPAMLIHEILGFIVLVPIVIASIVIGIFIGAQRLHDIGWSAWLLLIFIVPFIGGFFSFVMFLMPGNKETNQYGPPPPANSTSVVVIASLGIALQVIGFLSALALPALVANA